MQEKLNEMLQEEITKVESYYDLLDINPIIQIKKRKNSYGECHKSNGYATITISSYFLEAREEEIRSTILHEVLHCIKGSRGHDYIWKNAANKMLNLYRNDTNYYALDYHLNPNPYSAERSKIKDHFNMPLSNRMEYKYVLRCKECGKKFHYKKKCRTVDYYYKYKHSEDNGDLEMLDFCS